jgi:signal transduction histidine kinase
MNTAVLNSLVAPSPGAVPVESPGQASQRLTCLLDVAQVMNSSLELNAVLNHILSHAMAILDAEGGSVMLMEESSRRLRVVAARGPRAKEIQGRRQELGEGVAGWVALHGEPLLLHGAATDPRFTPVCNRQDLRDALSVPLRADKQVIGVVNVSNRRSPEPFSGEDLELLMALANGAALAIRNARSFQEVRHQRRTVERLLEEVTRAQEEERMRIALQMHDGPAQTMFAALRNLEAVRALAGEGTPELQGMIDALEGTIRQAIQETRGVMIDLKPPSLDGIPLHAALSQYARQFEQRTCIRARFSHKGPERRLPGTVESCLYRIAQEALTNTWKHAGASHAWVTLEIQDRFCSLEIRDDGKGFDQDAAAADGANHLGMSSVRERAELAGGRLAVTCPAGEGTTVRVTVPLAD